MECNFCHPSGQFANYDGDVAIELADHIDDTTVHLTSQDRQVLSDIENDLTQFATKEDLNNYYTKQQMDDFEYINTGYLEDNQIVNRRYLEDNHYANEEYVDTTIDAKLEMLDIDNKISNGVDDAYNNMQNYVIESLESIAPSVINNVDTTEYTLSNGDTIKLVLDNKNLSLNIAERISVVLSASTTKYRYNNGNVIEINIIATSTGSWAGYVWKYVVNGVDTSFGSNTTPSNTTVSIPKYSTTAQTVVLGYKKNDGTDTWKYSNTVTIKPGYLVTCYANSENNVNSSTLGSGEVFQKSSGNYVLYTNKNEVEFEVTANSGQYIFFGCPISWGNVMFKDTSTGLSETWASCGDFKVDGIEYRQYKSTNSNLGTVKYKLV